MLEGPEREQSFVLRSCTIHELRNPNVSIGQFLSQSVSGQSVSHCVLCTVKAKKENNYIDLAKPKSGAPPWPGCSKPTKLTQDKREFLVNFVSRDCCKPRTLGQFQYWTTVIRQLKRQQYQAAKLNNFVTFIWKSLRSREYSLTTKSCGKIPKTQFIYSFFLKKAALQKR